MAEPAEELGYCMAEPAEELGYCMASTPELPVTNLLMVPCSNHHGTHHHGNRFCPLSCFEANMQYTAADCALINHDNHAARLPNLLMAPSQYNS